MMPKASVAIFRKSVEYPKDLSPEVPAAVFDAAKRVIASKGLETLRLREGFYLIQYSETGPFKESLSDEWLPVYIARISEWSSGGIKTEEMEAYGK
jgi:hypothetical protein